MKRDSGDSQPSQTEFETSKAPMHDNYPLNVDHALEGFDVGRAWSLSDHRACFCARGYLGCT